MRESGAGLLRQGRRGGKARHEKPAPGALASPVIHARPATAAGNVDQANSQMISFFRNFFQSKLGIGITLAFLGLIALAFAASDVTNTGMFGGVAGGDRVAVVGDRRISTTDLNQSANNALQQQREQNPTLSMEAFVARGGLEDVLDAIVSRSAIAEFGRSLGLRVSERLVNSEITSLPAFQGVDGNFDPEAFRGALRQRGLTESLVRDDLALGLYARQMVLPIAYQARLPQSFAARYAQLLNETRIGSAAAFPAAAFAPEGDPTNAQLQAFYQENRSDYIRPERRVIRYAAFDQSAIGNLPAISDAQIAARYRANSADYAARQTRSFTQLVVPTRAAAQAVIDELDTGVSLEASARSKGLATSQVENVERQAFAASASQAVAAAGFGASNGAVAGPVQGALGWYVLRVDEVTQVQGRTLAQASGEIREALQAEQRRTATAELTERIQDEFAEGRTLAEVAEELDLEISDTPPLLATGQVFDSTETAPQELARVISFAFEMEEREPQITEVIPGQAFVIFDVGEITPSAAAPLAEIREGVAAQWKRERGMAAAGQAAARVMKRIEGGASIADAVRQEETALPAPQTLRLNRQQLAQQGQVTRATVLFFSMAEGTVKRVAGEGAGVWYVVQLDEIEAPDLAEDDPLIAQTQQQLAATVGEEYVEQFVAAAEAALEIERNEAGIDAVRQQLVGANQ